MSTENTSIEKTEGTGLAISPEIITSLVLNGDLSKMSDVQKVDYYNQFCKALQLNPLTQPFELISLNGKLRMYAKKDCTDQLRKVHAVSITDIEVKQIGDNYIVIAKGCDRSGRIDSATAVLSVKNLAGENLANAMMKCETKAKRRLTLSLCGLGILDELEVESINPKEHGQTSTNTHNPNATPNAPKDEDLATQEQLDTLLDLLADGALGEMIFDGKIKKAGMVKSLNTKFTNKMLSADKAEEYIVALREQILEADGIEDVEHVDVVDETKDGVDEQPK